MQHQPSNSTNAKISTFERNLSWWVLTCIAVGITLGQLAPHLFQAIANVQLAQVNLPVAVLIWLMIIPMLLKIDLTKMQEVKQHSSGFMIKLAINWLVKPFPMALLAGLFILHWFAPKLPCARIDRFTAG